MQKSELNREHRMTPQKLTKIWKVDWRGASLLNLKKSRKIWKTTYYCTLIFLTKSGYIGNPHMINIFQIRKVENREGINLYYKKVTKIMTKIMKIKKSWNLIILVIIMNITTLNRYT
jgi:hypothetical protein